MTKILLELKMDALREVQNHGDMVDGVAEAAEVVAVGDGGNDLSCS